jgi:hypothetical protein
MADPDKISVHEELMEKSELSRRHFGPILHELELTSQIGIEKCLRISHQPVEEIEI